MNTKSVNNQTALLAHIAELKLKKDERELMLKHQIQETIQSLDQMKIMKSMIRQIAKDNEIKKDIVKIAIGFGLKMVEKKLNVYEQKKTKWSLLDYFLSNMHSTIVEIAPLVILGREKPLRDVEFDSKKAKS